MNDCPFCKKSGLNLLAETKSAIVFFSNPRLVKGHLLVIPKRHVEKLWELSKEETVDIMSLIKNYQQNISENIAAGCDLRQNYRPFLEQNNLKVDHLHFHLIPRGMNDAIYAKTDDEQEGLFHKIEKNEVEEMTNRLRGV